MAGNNRRSLTWNRMDGSQHFWFILMCLFLVGLIVLCVVDSTTEFETPQWLGIIIAISGLYITHKNTNVIHIWDDYETDDDDDDDDIKSISKQ